MTPTPGDDLSSWKKLLGKNLDFGSSYLAAPAGGNNDWSSRITTSKYQFAVVADQVNSQTRDIKRDFLQVLTINGDIHKLATPPFISRIFTIPAGVKYSSSQTVGTIETPESQISHESDVRKRLTLVPVQIADNLPATGVDITSRTASQGDVGYQANNWIMAPAGKVPVKNIDCNNAMQFKIPLPTGVRLKISCPNTTPSPATISPHVGSEPTVVWHGTTNASSDETPIFKVGTEESVVDLPIRVKVMKNRKVKVQVHFVNLLKPNGDTRE